MWPSLLLPPMFFDSYFSCLFCRRKTRIFRGSLSFFTAHSSDHNTLRQSSTVQCRCALAHANRCLACFLFIKGLSTALHFLIPASRNRRRRVCSEMLLIVSARTSAIRILVLRSAVRTI